MSRLRTGGALPGRFHQHIHLHEGMEMDTYLGTIIAVAFDFAPRGFMLCQGQLLSIQHNTALFSLLGTRYGGNGITHFALPDLRGHAPAGTASLAGDKVPEQPHPVNFPGDAFGAGTPVMQPSPGINYCICVEGIFPSRP